MPSLPAMDFSTKINLSPHVVLLGAGASRAAFPHGDAAGRKVPLMCDLLDCLELRPFLNTAGIATNNAGFEALYDGLASSGKHHELVREIENRVENYFSQLRMPETATIYDYLVLSLRKKDIIASFNWDPFLALAWQRNWGVVELPRIVFLHGNVEMGVCPTHQAKGGGFRNQRCNECNQALAPTQLLFPVRHKDYSDAFIRSQWTELTQYLNYAYLFEHPRRSCEAFAMATLQNDPWSDNPFPRTKVLAKLQEWTRLLWIEETTGRLSGKTCHELRNTSR